MELESIDFSKLEEKSAPNRWGKDKPWQDRRLFFDAKNRLFIKIWAANFCIHRTLCFRGIYEQHATRSVIGFDRGFFNQDIACALTEFVFDQAGNCRGYVTKEGCHLPGMEHSLVAPFVERVMEMTAKTGLGHTDLCFNNLILVDGRISFIDYDTVLTDLKTAKLEFELQRGSLRRHVYPAYREFLLQEMIRLKNEDAERNATAGGQPS